MSVCEIHERRSRRESNGCGARGLHFFFVKAGPKSGLT